MMRPISLELVPRIDEEEAKREFDRGGALVVDTRSADEYNLCHIAGAISIPLPEILSRADELPTGRLIITYCT